MSEAASSSTRRAGLVLAALGVVYGDIGTSPLYAMRECFHGPHAIAATPAHVLGVLSLILWSLLLIVSVKYLGFVLRADNRGEGGILALMALAVPDRADRRRRTQLAAGAGDLRGRVALWRRNHHALDDGVERGGRAERGDARL